MLKKYQGFVLYRQIWQSNENITDYRGKWPCFYQLGVPAVRGFKQGSGGQKSKSPLFPGAGRPWLQMTSALLYQLVPRFVAACLTLQGTEII